MKIFCALLLPGNLRRAAFCIRAFNIEVSLIGDKITEENIGLMRYKWWNEALGGIYNEKSALKHPVVLELNKVIKEHKLLKRQFTRLITARSNSIPKTGFKTMTDMEAYAEESTSPVYYLILQAAGLTDVKADHAASHLGKAQGLVNLIRSIPHHASRRRCLVPEDLLLKHDVPQEAFMSSRYVSTKGVRDVVFDIASSGKIHLDKARQLCDDVPKAARTVFLPAIATRNYLERLRDIDFDIFHYATHERSPNLGFNLFWAKLTRSY
uniref:15-cis-phytoene synthase n=1 Tax=Lygus hesperus TaxID=30085 RepID=A0A0A9Y2V1_LYGHE